VIPKDPYLIVFTVGYLVLAAIAILVTGNREFAMYLGHMLVIIPLVLWAHKGAQFSRGVLWGLSIWGLLHMAGGTVPVPLERAQLNDPEQTKAVLYCLWLIPPNVLKYDNLVHAFGFFMTTLACGQAIRRFLNPSITPTLALFVVLAAAGMGFGATNEIIEFIATRLFDTNVGGYVNNSIDLIYNAVGACLAAAILWAKWGRSDRNESARAQGAGAG